MSEFANLFENPKLVVTSTQPVSMRGCSGANLVDASITLTADGTATDGNNYLWRQVRLPRGSYVVTAWLVSSSETAMTTYQNRALVVTAAEKNWGIVAQAACAGSGRWYETRFEITSESGSYVDIRLYAPSTNGHSATWACALLCAQADHAAVDGRIRWWDGDGYIPASPQIPAHNMAQDPRCLTRRIYNSSADAGWDVRQYGDNGTIAAGKWHYGVRKTDNDAVNMQFWPKAEIYPVGTILYAHLTHADFGWFSAGTAMPWIGMETMWTHTDTQAQHIAWRVTKRGGHDISLKAGSLNLLHVGAYTPDEWAGLVDRYTTGEISLPWLDGIDRRSQDGRDPYRP